MHIVRDNSTVTDNFSYITPPMPSPTPPARLTPPMPSPTPPAPLTPPIMPPSGGGRAGGRMGDGGTGTGGGGGGRRWGGGYGGGYGGGGYGYPVPYPVPAYGGYDYPSYPETVIVAAPPEIKKEEKKESSTKKATPIDMMGIMPYIVTGGVGAVAGYFVAKNQNKNVWQGAGIGAGIIVAGMFLYNQTQKK